MYPLVPFFTHIFDEHERQDNIVQHMHSCRLHLKSCLAFFGEVVSPVKLSDHGLPLVGSDQLGTTIWYNVSVEGLDGISRSVPWDNPSP